MMFDAAASRPPRRVVLGVSGSIAAYKAAEIVRLLQKAGVEVHCILTRAGAEFITPLTLGTLSGHPVTTGMFDEATGGPYMEWSGAPGTPAPPRAPSQAPNPAQGSPPNPAQDPVANPMQDPAPAEPTGGIRHIQVTRESDLVLVAPASGNILGKVAHGIADDALSTAIMASSAPVVFAPAMNTRMWESAAVQANVHLLKERGFLFVSPGTGELACGEMGTGRMADPAEIVAFVLGRLGTAGRGRRLLVTAGRTEEDLDPVRFLTNRSSGRMGFAVAEAARDRGYAVTVVAGATSVDPPLGVELVRVRSAAEMARAVADRQARHEILVMTAAVADYRPRHVEPRKIAGRQRRLTLDLEPTEDILASLRGQRAGQVTIGFALETDAELEGAKRKLASKGADCIVLNNPTRPGSAFGGETNEVTLLFAGGRIEALPLASKRRVAEEILRHAEELLAVKSAEAAVPGPAGRRGGEDRAAAGASRRAGEDEMNGDREPLRAEMPGPGGADPQLAALQEIIRLAEEDRRRGIRYWFDPELTAALRDRVREVSTEPPAQRGFPLPRRHAAARPASAASPAAASAETAVPLVTPAPSAASARPTWGPPPEAVGRATDWREQLAALGTEAAGCTACALCETRTKVVFGTGSGVVPLVFVGEAPGHDEDMTGEPFVGRAGQLLSKIIEAIGLTREQVYICNVLKCRPPQNRNPLPEEIVSCRHFLESQLELLQPKVICTLGLFAAQLLLDSALPIGKLRGRLHTEGRWPILPTFHPAYLLRNPAAKATVWEDVQLVRRILDG